VSAEKKPPLVRARPLRYVWIMEIIEDVNQSVLRGLVAIAESDQFAIYAEGDDTYILVQRHGGTPWTAVRLSGDGLFRVGTLVVEAMRHLYRDVASNLEPRRLELERDRSAPR
jgi:hypothetical protein